MEFCVENLLFWQAAYKYRNAPSTTSLRLKRERTKSKIFKKDKSSDEVTKLASLSESNKEIKLAPLSTKSDTDDSPSTVNSTTTLNKIPSISKMPSLPQLTDVSSMTSSDDSPKLIPADKKAEAFDIYEKFIKVGAVLEVNISDPIRKEVMRNIQSGEFDLRVFQEVEKYIYYELSADSFGRFKKSYLYTKYERESLLSSVKEQNLKESGLY